MIDGFKIIIQDFDPNHWQDNPYLSLNIVVNEGTGVLVSGEKFADLDGLRFSVSPCKSPPGKYFAMIRGSLHRWANNGGDNAQDFTFAQLKAAITKLCEVANIDPHRCTLHKLEFGVNIPAPMPAAQFLRRIVTLPDRPFVAMNPKKPALGKVATVNELKLKAYDKGQQTGSHVNNLVRLEVATDRMRPLQKANIKTLADLLNPQNLDALGVILSDLVTEIITDEPGVKPQNEKDKIRWEQYRNPLHWQQMHKQKRYKARQVYRRFVAQHLTNPPLYCALLEVRKTWSFLLNVDHLGVTFPRSENTPSPGGENVLIRAGGDFSTFKMKCGKVTPSKIGAIEGEKNDSDFLQKNTSIDKQKNAENQQATAHFHKGGKNDFSFIFLPKTQTKPNTCRGCGRDLSSQPPGSKYCRGANGGRACRNLARDQRRRAKVAYELAAIDALELDHLGNLVLYFSPGYTPPPSVATVPGSAGVIRYRGQHLQPRAPVPAASITRSTLPNLWPLVRVDVLSIDEGRPVLSFTATRAKRFARWLMQQNQAKTPGKMHIDSA